MYWMLPREAVTYSIPEPRALSTAGVLVHRGSELCLLIFYRHYLVLPRKLCYDSLIAMCKR